jgi:hypothetical protein
MGTRPEEGARALEADGACAGVMGKAILYVGAFDVETNKHGAMSDEVAIATNAPAEAR